LNKDGKKHKSANAFEDGMLLIVPYLPERDEAAVQYTKLLAGMRDPSKSAGEKVLLAFSNYSKYFSTGMV
jgi:hypothetical protein